MQYFPFRYNHYSSSNQVIVYKYKHLPWFTPLFYIHVALKDTQETKEVINTCLFPSSHFILVSISSTVPFQYLLIMASLFEAIPPAYNHSRPSHALNFTFTLPWKRCLETREGSYACLFDRSLFFVIIIISLFLLPALSFSYVTFPLRGSHVSPAFVGRSYRGIFISYC